MRAQRGLTIIATSIALLAPPAQAVPVDIGAAGGFALLTLGGNLRIEADTTVVNGDIGIAGDPDTGNTIEGGVLRTNKSTINGDIFLHSNAVREPDADTTINGSEQTGPSVDALLDQAVTDALFFHADYAGRSCTGALCTITSINDATVVITLADGLNVINLDELLLNSDMLTLDASGATDASIVVNVGGKLSIANSQIVLAGDLQEDEVLFNVVGTDDVSINKNGTVFRGVLLAPDAANVILKDDGAEFHGSIIAAKEGNDHFRVISGADLFGPTVDVRVPEPSALVLLATALFAAGVPGALARRKGVARRAEPA